MFGVRTQLDGIGWTKEMSLVFLQYVEKVDIKPIVILFNGYETKPRQAQCSFGVKMSYKYGGVKIYSINDITI